MRTYYLRMVEANKDERVIEISDEGIDAILTALGNLIEDYENIDCEE